MECQHDRAIYTQLGQLLGRVNEYLDQQVQLPRMDVRAKEALALWQGVPHGVLLIVRHPLANGARGREGCSIPTSPEIQQSRKNCWIVALGLEPIFEKGNMVVLDSGFCVLKGIVELKKHGVYASTLLKKQKYWPKYIKGDAIKEHFDDKDVGDCDSWKATWRRCPSMCMQ